MEKMIFNKNAFSIEGIEEKWMEYKQDLVRDILKKIIKSKKVFGTTIHIPLNFTMEDVWIDRLNGFLTGYLFYSEVKSDKAIITIAETNDLNRLKKSIHNIKTERGKLKAKLLFANAVLEQTKTVLWNKQKVEKINDCIQSDIQLLNGLEQILRQEVLNLFVQRVKNEYGISVSDDTLLNLLHEIIPHFNTKEVDDLTWKAIRKKMNVIVYMFQCMQNAS